MIANVSAHRRANAFAQALDDRTDPGPAANEQAEPTESAEPADRRRLLGLVGALGELPGPTLDPEVKVVQRAQLVAAMEAMLKEGTAGGVSSVPTVPEQRTSGRGSHRASPLGKLRPRSRWTKGLAAGGLTVGVAAGAFSGVAAASSDALPGDSLYGLKRGMEDIRLDLADDDAARGGLYLDHASTRLGEARRLMERGRGGHLDHESLAEIRRTLTGMRNDATEGHRLLHAAYEKDGSLGPIATLSSFSDAHRRTWDGLRDQLPVQLTDVGNEVSSVFDAIDQEVGPLQSKLPKPAARHRQDSSPDTSQRSDSPGTGSHRKPSSATPSTGESHSRSSDDGSPSPSGTGTDDATRQGGLISGAGGGLIDPPTQVDPVLPSTPSQHDTPDDPAPDVTIPPLLPDLLPGLGIDAQDVDGDQ